MISPRKDKGMTKKCMPEKRGVGNALLDLFVITSFCHPISVPSDPRDR
jgi:hypothetical protein